MQLSNLKKISIQNSLSKNINLRKISEIQFQVIELYKSKYRAEINEEVGISLAAEEIKERIERSYKDQFYEYKIGALNQCIIRYTTFEEISAFINSDFLERNLTLEEFYRKIRITHFDAISKVKKEDIIRAYSLLEVTNDSINTDKR